MAHHPLTDGTLLIRHDPEGRPLACWFITDHRPHRVKTLELDTPAPPPDLLPDNHRVSHPLPSVTIRTTKGSTYYAPRVTVTITHRQTPAGRRLRRLHLARPRPTVVA